MDEEIQLLAGRIELAGRKVVFEVVVEVPAAIPHNDYTRSTRSIPPKYVPSAPPIYLPEYLRQLPRSNSLEVGRHEAGFSPV